MAKRGIFTVVVCLLIPVGLPPAITAAEMELRAGLGYDFLSQQYFLDSAFYNGTDSTLTEWALRSTYLDDVKGQVVASIYPLADRSLELQTTLEQTADYLRLKMISNWDLRPGRVKIDIDNEFEWRNRFNVTSQFGDSYLFGYSRTKATVPIGKAYSVVSQARFEGVDFRSGASTAFDYVRVNGKVGLAKSFADFSFADLSLVVADRQVPDSAYMNYRSIGTEGSYFGFLPTGNLDLAARYEYKDYNRPDHQDDQHRFELYAHNRLALSNRWFTRQDIDLDGVVYAVGDWINANYVRIGGSFLGGLETGPLSVAAGPALEVLTEKRLSADSIAFDGEDYFERGFKLDLDYIGAGGLFASVESTTGYRDLKYENDYQSGFVYERVYLIGDLKLFSSVNFSVLFSAEWEWHNQRKDNSELYLLSSGLTYAF